MMSCMHKSQVMNTHIMSARRAEQEEKCAIRADEGVTHDVHRNPEKTQLNEEDDQPYQKVYRHAQSKLQGRWRFSRLKTVSHDLFNLLGSFSEHTPMTLL